MGKAIVVVTTGEKDARQHGHTHAAEVARQQGVAVSTVRTQIGSIRAKTGAGSISELVRQVAVLPPLVGALRAGVALGAR